MPAKAQAWARRRAHTVMGTDIRICAGTGIGTGMGAGMSTDIDTGISIGFDPGNSGICSPVHAQRDPCTHGHAQRHSQRQRQARTGRHAPRAASHASPPRRYVCMITRTHLASGRASRNAHLSFAIDSRPQGWRLMVNGRRSTTDLLFQGLSVNHQPPTARFARPSLLGSSPMNFYVSFRREISLMG